VHKPDDHAPKQELIIFKQLNSGNLIKVKIGLSM